MLEDRQMQGADTITSCGIDERLSRINRGGVWFAVPDVCLSFADRSRFNTVTMLEDRQMQRAGAITSCGIDECLRRINRGGVGSAVPDIRLSFADGSGSNTIIRKADVEMHLGKGLSVRSAVL